MLNLPAPPNKYVRGISYPQRNLDSVFSTVLELKEMVELLGGLHKDAVGRAALWEEFASFITTHNSQITVIQAEIDTIEADILVLQTDLNIAEAALAAHIANVSNPHAVTKAQVGLGNADNTSDVNKPVSTATQTALNLKANSNNIATTTEVITGTDNTKFVTPAGLAAERGNNIGLTIASGVVTLPGDQLGKFRISGEGGAADTLHTINGGVPGAVIILSDSSSGMPILYQTDTGNLRLDGDASPGTLGTLSLVWNDQSAIWQEIGRSRSSHGSYTATLTNVTNLAASTASSAQWSRVGNLVRVFGQVAMDPTAAGPVTMEMSLPIVSDLAAVRQLTGIATSSSGNAIASIFANAANNTAEFRWVAVSTANQTFYFGFDYVVL